MEHRDGSIPPRAGQGGWSLLPSRPSISILLEVGKERRRSVLGRIIAACALGCLLTAAPALAGGKVKAVEDWRLWSRAPWSFGLLERLGPFLISPSARPSARALEKFRPSQFRLGKVSSDFGAKPEGLGVEDHVRMQRAGRVKIDVRDLLQNDLGWKCEGSCDFKKTNKLDLKAFAAEDNIKLIVQKGKFIYIQAKERRKKATFTYLLHDKATGATADVRVNVWFGNRLPRTRRDKLTGYADTENVFAVSDLLSNDRDRDGDLLDLVRVWCPKNGRVFMREVDGELKIFFQPDAGFTGVAYFKYTIADLSDPDDVLVAGPGAPSPERKTFAEGLVRVRVLASPS